MGIGKFTRVENLSEEYRNLAQQDERVGMNLLSSGEYRHAIYFLIQAIEKYLKSKIFGIVDGRIEFFRDLHRNHSVERAVYFLVQTISTDPRVQQQLRSQLTDYVLRGDRFEDLNNYIRYPHYLEVPKYFASLSVSKADVESVRERLLWVKEFLRKV